MAANHRPERGHLSIVVDADLVTRIEQAAQARELSVGDYVAAVLQRAVEDDHGPDESRDQGRWSQLSSAAFARDWESDQDSVYDQLSSR